MRIKILIIGVSVFLFGCATNVEGWKIKVADEYCSDRGGIGEFIIVFGAAVICNDGKRFDIVTK